MMIGLVSAITIIAGNSYSFESEEFEYYTPVGNSSNMDGMNITWEDGTTTINLDLLFKPDNFSLIFFNEKEVVTEVHVGGGGTRTIYKDKIIDNYVDREVETEIKVIDQDEEDRLLGIANDDFKKRTLLEINICSFSSYNFNNGFYNNKNKK